MYKNCFKRGGGGTRRGEEEEEEREDGGKEDSRFVKGFVIFMSVYTVPKTGVHGILNDVLVIR